MRPAGLIWKSSALVLARPAACIFSDSLVGLRQQIQHIQGDLAILAHNNDFKITDKTVLLAVDLDGTFLESKDSQNDALYRYIHEHPDILLTFVTGRNTELVLEIFDDHFIPTPRFFIGDVGATIIDVADINNLQPLQPIHDRIAAKWHKTAEKLNSLSHITDQMERQDQPQERRMSYYVDPENVPEDLFEQLSNEGLNVLHSNAIYFDILPDGVNKGATLLEFIDHLGISKDRVMVAGDTLNDLSMYQTGLQGVVLANSEEPLKEAAKDLDNAYYSKESGTDGIFEALQHFDLIPKQGVSLDTVPKTKVGTSELVMVYHRLPFKEELKKGKYIRGTHTSPNGILPTLLGFFSEKQHGSWVAWTYADTRTPPDFEDHVSVDKDKYENLKVRRVPLTKDDVKIFYEEFSKEAFWPMLHSFHERASFNHDHWEHFLEINHVFAEKAAEEAAEGATVWIHDYNLWMVPGFLRQIRPDVKIAFYHHTPFPSADIFNMIPWRRDIINSLMQCDYIGFHIPQYVEHFADAVRSNYKTTVNEKVSASPHFVTYGCAIGVENYTTSLTTELNTVRLGAHPVGINCKRIEELVKNVSVRKLRNDIKSEIGEDGQIILSIERTDYTKGPVDKLKAYEKFLSTYPELHEKVTLIMVCTPPAKGMEIYEQISQDIAYHVGMINGRYGTYNWTPIRFVNRPIPFEDVIAYYKAADVGWVTPLRDGLNLVAKEYVMAKSASGRNGVLVLSEFAGAAAELHGACLTNPYDQQDMVVSLYNALHMSENEKDSRLRSMANIITKYDVNEWGRDFIESIHATGSAGQKGGTVKAA